jgi:hypothetical protein
MVDTEFGKSSIWVQSIFTLEEKKHEQIKDFDVRGLAELRKYLVRIDVLKDRLRLTSVLYKALHGIGDESVGEHVGDVVKVLGNNVGGATKVELSQLARLIGKKIYTYCN